MTYAHYKGWLCRGDSCIAGHLSVSHVILHFPGWLWLLLVKSAVCQEPHHPYVQMLDVSSDCNPEVTMAMLRWIYTDELDLREDDIYLTELMKLANRFQLQLLRERYIFYIFLQALLYLSFC